MSQKLPVDGFEWVEDILIINEKLKKIIKIIKSYDEESDIGYIFEVEIEYRKILHDLHSDLPFLPERMKINKCSKLVCNLYASVKSWINTKKVHRIIQFNQNAWLKLYIDMNNKVRKETKNDFEKDFFKLMNMLFLERLWKI